LVGWLIFLVG
jgi:hypothetical protein